MASKIDGVLAIIQIGVASKIAWFSAIIQIGVASRSVSYSIKLLKGLWKPLGAILNAFIFCF